MTKNAKKVANKRELVFYGLTAAAIIAVIGLGLMVYFKKYKSNLGAK